MMPDETSHAMQRPSARGSASWMVTLADLLALLLTFFVLLFSMNAVQMADWNSVIASLRKQFNPQAARISPDPVPDAEALRSFVPWGADLDYLTAVLRQKLDTPALEAAQLFRLADRLVISLPADFLFAPASAVPGAEAEAIAAELAADLRRLSNAVRVVGHTDESRITGGAYASNWSLSLARANAMADLLAENGYEPPVTVIGYGAGRFEDLSPRLPASRRAALARRVDIEIMATGRGGENAG